jgi:hypothetical protein
MGFNSAFKGLILVYSDNFVTLFKSVGTYFEPVNKFCGACSGAVG